MGGYGADGCDGRGDVCHDVSGEPGRRPTIVGRLGRPEMLLMSTYCRLAGSNG
jgi:hypothetical protein